MTAQGKLFIISAPSGSGKTTLCKLLKNRLPDLTRSISATTRPPRRGEKNGRDYIFLTEKEFKRVRRNGGFLEWAKNFGHYYGTPKDRVLKLIKGGKDVILAIDVKGARKVKRLYPDGIFIFILPPSMEELRKRLRHRGTDSKRNIKKRMEIARKEMSYLPMYDYSVINDTIKNAVEKLEAIVKAERRKAKT
jgi:guanylate kinase